MYLILQLSDAISIIGQEDFPDKWPDLILEIHKILIRIANMETLIRLLLKKQSSLDLGCLAMSF